MIFAPFENIKITSTLSKKEIIERVRSRVEYTSQFGMSFQKGSFKDYDGYVNENEFKFRRILKSGRNSFIPTVYGKIENNSGYSIILMQIRFHPIVYILLIFLTVFCGSFLFVNLSIGNFLFFLFPYIFCIVFYNMESKLLKNELIKITTANNV